MNNALSRRQWLNRVAAAAGSMAIAPELVPGVEAPAAGLIDAHVHVWTPDVARYPLAEGFSPERMRPPSFTPEQLFEHARPCGVGRVVLIQMSFYRYDNAYMLDTMARFPGVFAGVGIVDPAASDVADRMRSLARKGVRGFRLVPDTKTAASWATSSQLAAMWQLAAQEGHQMCLLVNPEGLPVVDQLCEQHPDTPVVIDHFGRVGVVGEIREHELANLCRLARHKRVCVKVSAFYALGQKRPPYDDLAPMIRRVLDAFGPERLMWASDCPFQVDPGHTYRASIDLVRERLDFLSDSDRQHLLRNTAERLFFAA